MGFEFNYITLVGFVAQCLFFSRFAVQLFLSEKAKASLSPTIFWQLSLLACYIMIAYGFLRNDFSVIEGQLITYFIYVRNLQLKGAWKTLPKLLRWLVIITPIVAFIYCISNYNEMVLPLFKNPTIPLFWLIFGTIGQSIFSSRFIYQWLHSEYRKESRFPLGFWILSSIGAGMITIYAIFTNDLVQFVGKGTGLLMYARNFYLKKLETK